MPNKKELREKGLVFFVSVHVKPKFPSSLKPGKKQIESLYDLCFLVWPISASDILYVLNQHQMRG